MHDGVILRPRGIHREVQPRLLRRRRAVDMAAGRVEPAERVDGEPAERHVRRRHQEAAVIGQPHAQIARGAAAVSAQKERAPVLDERLPRLLFRHRAHSSAFAKNSSAAEVAGLEREHEAVGIQARCPGHAGIELVAEREHADAQRLQHRGRCFAAGHDERPDAMLRQRDRERAEGLLDETPRPARWPRRCCTAWTLPGSPLEYRSTLPAAI